MADLGTLALLIALAASAYGIIVPHLGVRTDNWNLIRSTQHASTLAFAMVAIASGVLIHALVTSDFSIEYVWETSSTDMPLFYKVTAMWGGLEGSLLFWVLVQSFYTMVVALRYQYSNREVIPYVLVTLNLLQGFLLVLMIGWSNPLEVQSVIPDEGRGLNPLLQNPAMVAHPPMLYLGFIGFSIPFAFAMGGLIRGRLDNEWVLTTRRWTLLSWYFLSVGLILGGQWAYEELGWGGFWGWDPVENAAFMPWLTGTAFLHSVMIQEKRNMLRIWNVVLIILTYALTIIGTFLTRSGIINSVHSFTQSEIGPAFLVFLALILMGAFLLLFKRIQVLESEHRMEAIICRENAFLAQNVLFVSIAFTVLLGTTFPLLAEAVRGTKLSIQAPFFNTVIAPMGYLLLVLMGVGTLIAWRRSSPEGVRRNFQWPLVLASLLTLAFFMAKWGTSASWEVYLMIWGCTFVVATILIEFGKAAHGKAKQLQVNWLSGLVQVFLQNRRRYGGFVVHLGVVLIFLGFLGKFLSIEQNVTLSQGERAQVGDYLLEFQEVREFPVRNATHRAAVVRVMDAEGNFLEELRPAKSFYPTQPQPLTEVAIRRTALEDLYLIFSSENGSESGSVTLKVFVNPLVGWAWGALPVFAFGIIICLTYRPKRLVKRASVLRQQYQGSGESAKA